MRILIDPSSVHCLNLGDVAMLQVTVRRFREFWPDAEIFAFNEAPELLEMYCPGSKPVHPHARQVYFTTAEIMTRLGRRSSVPAFSELDVTWRRRWPEVVAKLLVGRGRPADVTEVRNFLELVNSCDLVVASGSGQINTSFGAYSTLILNTLELAQHHGIPTAILGQGLGPIDDACLRTRAAKVLPRVHQICVRETLVSLPLLSQLEVPKDIIFITGDDSIETVYAHRSDALGTAIGVNLRISWYSSISDEMLKVLRPALQQAARELGAPLLQVPISRHPQEDDSAICRCLFENYESVTTPIHNLAAVEGMIEEIGRCRVMVTTSYHGGVFALAQGIPVVAWLKSKYFAAKLQGLANQFGIGCEIVFLDTDDFQQRLRSAILNAWRSAEQVRPYLLDAARSQLVASRAAYERLRSLLLCGQAGNGGRQADTRNG